MSQTHPPAIFIMGPTASGKTSLSIQLAKSLETEIISVDSAMVYRGMDIGTAKPTEVERKGVVHHLIDILDPKQAFSTGEFRTQAISAMAEISAQGKIPILTGGTMLYFNTLSQGLAKLPSSDEGIRKRLTEELELSGKAEMHKKLAAVDPESALRIHPNDPQRILRAIEVYEMTGKPLSLLIKADQNQQVPYKIIKIILATEDRNILHDRIAQRFRSMIDDGLIEEVKKLYHRGDLSESLPAIRSVGYRQVWMYLQGQYDFSTMREKGIVATRQLAKRQFTWLRKESDAFWLNSEAPDVLARSLNVLQQHDILMS